MKKSCAVLLLLAAVFLSGCGGSGDQASETKSAAVLTGEESQEERTFAHISQEEAWEIMNRKEFNGIVLDVRTPDEYSEGHIPGAICIPNETISDQTPSELPDKAQMILVYCRSGNRSKEASEKLAKLGYTDIREFGGIQTWEYDVE